MDRFIASIATSTARWNKPTSSSSRQSSISKTWRSAGSLSTPAAHRTSKWFGLDRTFGNAPSEKHRQGLRLRVRLAGDKGVAREFSSTAATLWNSIDRLHDEFERNRGKHSGKLPYVRLAKLEQVKTLLGIVFAPTFEIISWVVRPAELVIAPPAVVADPAEIDAADFDDEIVV